MMNQIGANKAARLVSKTTVKYSIQLMDSKLGNTYDYAKRRLVSQQYFRYQRHAGFK